MTIEIKRHPSGVLLPVHAQPGSRKNEIKGERNGSLKVSVTQIPEKGKANKVIAEFIAKTLGLRRSQIELVSGETSPAKIFLIKDLSAEDLLKLIQPYLD